VRLEDAAFRSIGNAGSEGESADWWMFFGIQNLRSVDSRRAGFVVGSGREDYLCDAAVNGLILNRKCGWFFGSGTERSIVNTAWQDEAWACRSCWLLVGGIFAVDGCGYGAGSADCSGFACGSDECSQ
jgi:hypothetical protein